MPAAVSGDEAPGDVALLSSTSAPDDHGGGGGGGGGGGDIVTGSDRPYAPTSVGVAATRAVWETLLAASDEPSWRATIRASTPPGMFDGPEDAGEDTGDGAG